MPVVITTRAEVEKLGLRIQDQGDHYIQIFGDVPRKILIPVVMNEKGKVLPMIDVKGKYLPGLAPGESAPKDMLIQIQQYLDKKFPEK